MIRLINNISNIYVKLEGSKKLSLGLSRNPEFILIISNYPIKMVNHYSNPCAHQTVLSEYNEQSTYIIKTRLLFVSLDCSKVIWQKLHINRCRG